LIQTFVGRGKATYRERGLRVAREIAKPGDIVQVKQDGTIAIVTGKADDSEKSETLVTPLEEWRGKRRGQG
jgi:hypothetical protein